MWAALSVLALLVLAAGAAVLIRLARISRRAAQPVLRRFGPVVFASGALGCVVVIVIALVGYYRLEVPRNRPVPTIKVAGTAAQVARGERLAHLCMACHSSTGKLPLDGSTKNVVDFPPLGTLRSPNLTPGGPIKDWSDSEVVRAIREGIAKNGRPMLGMTSWAFRHMSDDDVQALVAYLRATPAVAHTVPGRDLNLIAALSVGIGLAPTSVQPSITGPIVAPQAGVNAAYGRYLTAISGCRDCHGADLNGGRAPLGISLLSPTPLGPSLFVSVGRLREAGFVTTMRTGVRPNGRAINATLMPWQDFAGAFSDDDLRAMFAYLSSVDIGSAREP